jgi:signal recognition particle receptor subunit beta
MSFVNYNAKEIHCKIVYYGPSLAGKTTNMQWIYHQTQNDQKSKLVSLDTDVERTLFFDFLPLSVGEIRGFKTRFHLYTVPGQVIYDASRKLILKGLDGVIFVADSQAERIDENIESMKNLEKNLRLQGYDLRDVPMAIQYNKRDLDNISSLEELKSELNTYNCPDYEGVASEGQGVMEPLKTVSNKIINVLKSGKL